MIYLEECDGIIIGSKILSLLLDAGSFNQGGRIYDRSKECFKNSLRILTKLMDEIK